MTTLRDTMELEGKLSVFERPEGSRIWRPKGVWRNTILNGFYSDLLYWLTTRGYNPASAIYTGASLYGGVTSTGHTVGLTSQNYSALILNTPLPVQIPNGITLQMGFGGPLVGTVAAANVGDQFIPVNWTPPSGVVQNTPILQADSDVWPQQLALGFGNAAVARTDPGLQWEWQNFIGLVAGSIQINSGTNLTSIPLAFPLPMALAAGATFTTYAYTSSYAGAQTPVQQTWTVAAAGAAIGATSIPVVAQNTSSVWFTAGQGLGFPAARIYYATAHTPQRMAVTSSTQNTADPASATFSFFLPAAANTVAVQFQEAGLLYNAPSGVAGGSGNPMSHLLFSYQKGPNTDSRFDYTLTRA